MEAKDLMIGDYVRLVKEYGNPQDEIIRVGALDLYRISRGDYEVEPIPLTAEILEKNGYEHKTDIVWHDIYMLRYRIKLANKQNAKENNAAKGSFTQMRAELKQMIKAYDNMSKAEREAADKGGALLQQIQDQTRAIQEAEMACGRYQRNVGNYPKVFDTKALGDNLEAQQAQKDAIKANNDVIKELVIEQTLMLAKDPYGVFYWVPKMAAVSALDFRFVHELQHLMRMLQIDKEVEL